MYVYDMANWLILVHKYNIGAKSLSKTSDEILPLPIEKYIITILLNYYSCHTMQIVA